MGVLGRGLFLMSEVPLQTHPLTQRLRTTRNSMPNTQRLSVLMSTFTRPCAYTRTGTPSPAGVPRPYGNALPPRTPPRTLGIGLR